VAVPVLVEDGEAERERQVAVTQLRQGDVQQLPFWIQIVFDCFCLPNLLELMVTFLRSAQDQVGITFCPKVTIG